MPNKIHIPQTRAEFSAEWFSDTVFASKAARVTAVTEITNIGDGIGFLGLIYRCHLEWDRAAADLPASVVVKVPAAPGVNRASGETIQAYEREIVAYRDLGADMGLPMPRFYYAELDKNPAAWLQRPVNFLFDKLPMRAVNWLLLRLIAASGKIDRRYVLVIEDIDDARPPTQVAGGSVADAGAALEVLARFHAHHWMRTATVEAHPVLWPVDQTPKVWQASYARNRDAFAEQFAAFATEDHMRCLDRVQQCLPSMVQQLAAEPWTMMHGDYRLDNILFRPDDSLVVLDFQSLLKARPGFDVAYFITTALAAEHRSHEELLLRRYHAALVSAGVGDYPFEALLADCAAMKELIAHRLVVTVDTLDTAMKGHDASFVGIIVERMMGWLDVSPTSSRS